MEQKKKTKQNPQAQYANKIWKEGFYSGYRENRVI